MNSDRCNVCFERVADKRKCEFINLDTKYMKTARFLGTLEVDLDQEPTSTHPSLA